MSIFSELNSDIVNAGTVRYDSNTGYIQYTADGGTTWTNLMNVNTPVRRFPTLTDNHSSPLGVASGGFYSDADSTGAYHFIGLSDPNSYGQMASGGDNTRYLQFDFAEPTYIKYLTAYIWQDSNDGKPPFRFEWSDDGVIWNYGDTLNATNTSATNYTQNINAVVKSVRLYKTTSTWYFLYVKQFEAWN